MVTGYQVNRTTLLNILITQRLRKTIFNYYNVSIVIMHFVVIYVFLLHWHYSPMRAFASIIDVLQTVGPRPYFWFPNRQFFTGWDYQPHAQPPTWRTRSYIYNPLDWMAQLYPQALGDPF